MTAATMRKQIALYAAQFPSPGCCTAEGILCAGGDLLPARLLAAYSRGIFPWYGEDMPLLWWCPDPRCVLPPDAFHLPRRSARALRNHPFELRMDTAFSRVIRACAAPRRDSEGTWILPEMIAAYERLHALGYAHSVEAWRDGELLGGLYGVALGRAFFGESMFHLCPEASRAALAGLVAFLRERDFLLLDCQQATPHMLAMGARVLTQDQYAYLQKHLFILSALYGALRPLDGVSPYRLEMQAKFCPQPGTDLYAFWRPRLTTALLAGAREAGDACDKPLLINLASAEYAKAVDKTQFTWLDVRFLERTKQGKWAERAVTCKKARGAMVSFLAERQADNPQILQEFTAFNMVFDPAASTELCLIFRQESD